MQPYNQFFGIAGLVYRTQQPYRINRYVGQVVGFKLYKVYRKALFRFYRITGCYIFLQIGYNVTHFRCAGLAVKQALLPVNYLLKVAALRAR